MSEVAIFCEGCFDELKKRSVRLAALWIELCKKRCFVSENVFITHEDLKKHELYECLAWLETTERFVYTLENLEGIKIRIRSAKLTEEGRDFFTLKDCDHA